MIFTLFVWTTATSLSYKLCVFSFVFFCYICLPVCLQQVTNLCCNLYFHLYFVATFMFFICILLPHFFPVWRPAATSHQFVLQLAVVAPIISTHSHHTLNLWNHFHLWFGIDVDQSNSIQYFLLFWNLELPTMKCASFFCHQFSPLLSKSSWGWSSILFNSWSQEEATFVPTALHQR